MRVGGLRTLISRRSRPLFFLGYAFAAPAAGIHAQATSSEITGVVVTEKGEPLRDVALSIRGSDLATSSDAAGRFHFATAPWGQVRLRARAVGFSPLDTLVLLQSGMS